MGFIDLERKDSEDWNVVIGAIRNRRTHEAAAFREQFEKILSDPSHEYHLKGRQLQALYDFTPLRAVEGEGELPK